MASLLRGTAYITGAGSGIGQFTALAFARNGVKKMALTDIIPKNLETTIDLLKKQSPDVEIEAIQMDTGKEEDVERSIAQTIKRFGGIDYAINNAGIGGNGKPTVEQDLTDWQRVVDVNLNVCCLLDLRLLGKLILCRVFGCANALS
jgi:NAD(P)-dependent dehydrogenase (short-subunit alcohol dehydrogenase family)